MDETRTVTRRDALRLGAVTATAVGGLFSIRSEEILAAGKNQPQISFTVMIEKMPLTSANVLEVSIDELVIETSETTGPNDQEWRRFEPGILRRGRATILTRLTPGVEVEIKEWIQALGAPPDPCRKIEVSLVDNLQRSWRGYTLLDSTPERWRRLDYGIVRGNNHAGASLSANFPCYHSSRGLVIK